MALAGLVNEISKYNAQLVAVSKTQTEQRIMDFYEKGQRVFGENRVPELVEKQTKLPADIEWHFIGHLQSNKVKYIAPFVSFIHAVDSWKLLKEINKQAEKSNRVIKVLLQFKIADEESKYGLSFTEGKELLEAHNWQELTNVAISGVMGMATYTDDKDQIRTEFKSLRTIFEELKNAFFSEQTAFQEISMGMSGDYPIALEEGSTMIRVGSLLFNSSSS